MGNFNDILVTCLNIIGFIEFCNFDYVFVLFTQKNNLRLKKPKKFDTHF